MKKAQTITLSILGIMLLMACNSNHQSGTLKLNNGEKWEVNEDMSPHIDKGNELVHEFISQKGTDFQTLAENLISQNNNLIQSCTMKGESHDELHKWLHPHMDLINKLSNASNLEEAKVLISQIDQSFETYQNYFE
jgi:hypothetical protein